jgi:ceramide glucosyltransferase
MLTANTLLYGIVAVAVSSTLLSIVCLFLKTRNRSGLPEFTPPVTIYKPLKGVDEGLEENLRSFFELDYPQVQLLFGVVDPKDPAVEVVRKLMAEFPSADAKLVTGAPTFGLNPKVENLAALAVHRRHEVILISDSNVRVRPSYLRETACYLADPKVGLVTNVFCGTGEVYLGASLENFQLNGFIAGNVATASALGMVCVVGKSMLMPQRVLDEVGGFAGVRNLLAEDQALGLKVRRAGYAIRLSHHVIENVNRDRDLYWFLNRHSRWFKIRRRLALPIFLIEPMANLTVVGLVWALSDETGIAWGGLVALLGLSLVRDAVQTKWLRGSYPKLRHLPLSWVKDLFLLPVWIDALFDRRIKWRGNRFVIGRFTRLRRERAARDVRRRVRRARKNRYRHDAAE